MASNNTTAAAKEIAQEIPNVIRLYKDGSVVRLFGSPHVPPSFPDEDPLTKVSSKDITISSNVSARLYLPFQPTSAHEKVPILVYFHGGAFCVESAFSFLYHRHMNALILEAQVIIVSVEYRLAPEHPLPVAYEDCWEALQWVTSHFPINDPNNSSNKDSWILEYGDFDRLFLGGDSAGANIVHYLALRAKVEALESNVKVLGAFLANPYFWGSKPIGHEPVENHDKSLPLLLWDFVYPSAPNGIDNPMINFMSNPGGLAGLGCSKLLVCVAGKDELRDRGVLYYDLVKQSGWEGEVELFEMEGEGHCFHIFDVDTENSKKMFKRLASFLLEH